MKFRLWGLYVIVAGALAAGWFGWRWVAPRPNVLLECVAETGALPIGVHEGGSRNSKNIIVYMPVGMSAGQAQEAYRGIVRCALEDETLEVLTITDTYVYPVWDFMHQQQAGELRAYVLVHWADRAQMQEFLDWEKSMQEWWVDHPRNAISRAQFEPLLGPQAVKKEWMDERYTPVAVRQFAADLKRIYAQAARRSQP